jgi:arabinoxylan arabinofuranohydrolase
MKNLFKSFSFPNVNNPNSISRFGSVMNQMRILICILCLFSVSVSFGQTSGNPILAGYQADPDITYLNGRYYIFPTAVTNNQFHAYSSSDLTNWRDDGVIFDLGPQCAWANVNGWAPCMVARNGKYYFYYTAEAKIGVAVGNSPTGPFTDKGSALIGSDPYTVDIIDPMVFINTDGQAYIYYGGSNGSKLVVRKLNSDMISVGTPSLITPPNYTEAPHMIKRGNVYHLTYSNGAWFNGTYNVQYATSSSPTGPWSHKGQILSSAGPFTGPGHHAIVQKPGCDEYYVAYHRYQNGDYSTRKICIDRLIFKGNGEILPVNMTWAGVVARAGSAGCFSANAIGNGTYRINSRLTTSSGQSIALDISNCGQAAGDDVRTWTPSTCLGQRWAVTYDGNGYYEIVSQQSTHHALDLVGCDYARGADVKIWNDLNNDCQRWRIESIGDNWYRILSRQSGYALDVSGCSNVPGANVATWDWNGQNCQQWRFEAISPTREAIADIETDGDLEMQASVLFPNPVTKESFVVQYYSDRSQQVNIDLTDALSRNVIQKIWRVNAGRNELSMESASLSNGMHFITIKDDHAKTIVLKVLISK